LRSFWEAMPQDGWDCNATVTFSVKWKRNPDLWWLGLNLYVM
jgi:hypothetical protein